MSTVIRNGFHVLPGLLTSDEIEKLRRAIDLDRFVPHRARPTRGLQGRWSVVMWLKAGGPRSAC